MKNKTIKLNITLPERETVKRVLMVIGLVLIGFGLGSNQESLKQLLSNPITIFRIAQGSTVSPKQLASMLTKKNLTLINVHTPYEGEIEKTDTFIPYDQIVANASSLPKDKNAPIILYCKSGRMSSEALETIQKLGYTNVRHLAGGMDAWQKNKGKLLNLSDIQNEVLPSRGFELPVVWADLGQKLVSLGVIDLEKFKQTVNPSPEQLELLTTGSDKKITIDATNSQFIVDMLWAVGLAQKSTVYDEGPMGQEYKKDVGNFASTGGWTLARGDALNYLNQFDLIPLTDGQQKQVSEIAKNVYRPCCGNSTWFPDCNHGMAALAAIELMVSAGVPEKEIYRNVLALNSFWFPDSYLTAATYFARQGTIWANVDAKKVLGEEFSSSQGASALAQKVGQLPYQAKSAGGCGA